MSAKLTRKARKLGGIFARGQKQIGCDAGGISARPQLADMGSIRCMVAARAAIMPFCSAISSASSLRQGNTQSAYTARRGRPFDLVVGTGTRTRINQGSWNGNEGRDNRSGGQLPKEAWAFEEFEYFSGGRNSTAVRIKTNNLDIWSIRADDPDKNIPGRIWTTEVVVALTGDGRCIFRTRLLVSSSRRLPDQQPDHATNHADGCKGCDNSQVD